MTHNVLNLHAIRFDSRLFFIVSVVVHHCYTAVIEFQSKRPRDFKMCITLKLLLIYDQEVWNDM